MWIGVCDIETTGLNPAVNHHFIPEGFTACRRALCISSSQKQEPKRKKRFRYLDILRDLDLVITYNGRHFDLPFVEKRWRRYSGASAALPYNLDLYLVLNGHSPIKRFVLI